MQDTSTTGRSPDLPAESGASLTRRGLSEELSFAAPLALAVAALQATALRGGGYYLADAGILEMLLTLFVAVLFALGITGGIRWRSAAGIALGALILYGMWSAASVLWADNAYAAQVEAGRTLTYAACLAIGTALCRAPLALRLGLATSVFVPTSVALYTLSILGDDVKTQFLNGRLLGTVGYFNAEPAYLVLPCWIAVAFAAMRSTHPALRALMLGAATLMVELAVLSQSRGVVIAALASGIVYMAISPARLRSLVPIAVAAIAVLVAFPRLDRVYVSLARDASGAGPAIDAAVRTMLLTASAAAVVMAVLALLDRRVQVPASMSRIIGRGMLAVSALALVGAVALVAPRIPSTLAKLTEIPDQAPVTTHGRLGAINSSSNAARIVLWRVAIQDAREHPVRGVGADNFEPTFYRRRARVLDRYAQQPHNLTLEVIAERGVIGLVLFTAFLLALAAGCAASLRRRAVPRSERAVLAGAVGAVACWLTQAQLEWFWQFPALTGTAMVLAGMVLGTTCGARRTDRQTHPVVRVAVVAIFGVTAVLGIGAPFLSERLAVRAAHRPSGASERALAELRTARVLAPTSPVVAQVEARLRVDSGDVSDAQRAIGRFVATNPSHWATHVTAQQLYSAIGDTRSALREIRTARRLNPGESDLRAQERSLEPPPADGLHNGSG